MKTKILFLFAVLVILIRVGLIFSIYPGNAPDEFGHMTIITALSQGKFLNLKEEKEYSNYPYSMYNPFGYLPSVAVLHMTAWKVPQINQLTKPVQDFSIASNIVARLGHLFWSLLYVFFLVLLIRDDSLLVGLTKGILLAFLPQIAFVQSYVNLDAAGLPFFLYLIWSIERKKFNHIALSVFFIMNCKLNYLCTLALPGVCFLFWFKNDFRIFLRFCVIYLGIPILLGSTWFLYRHFASSEFGGFSVLHALRTLYDEHPPRWAVFSRHFLDVSLGSAFGAFGYMNQWMATWIYRVWEMLIFLPATVALGVLMVQKGYLARGFKQIQLDPVQVGMFAVFFSNFVIHYYTSFTTFYQPQGRYLFPAVTVVLLSFVRVLHQTVSWRKLPLIASVIILFLVFSFGVSVPVMSGNPFEMGFGITRPDLAQTERKVVLPLIHGKTVIRQPFTSQSDKIRRVSIAMATYMKRISGQCEFQILDSRDHPLYSQVLSLSEVLDNRYLNIYLKPFLHVVPGERYALVLRPKGTSIENGFTIYASQHATSEDTAVQINGKNADNTLAFSIYGLCDTKAMFRWPFEKTVCSTDESNS